MARHSLAIALLWRGRNAKLAPEFNQTFWAALDASLLVRLDSDSLYLKHASWPVAMGGESDSAKHQFDEE